MRDTNRAGWISIYVDVAADSASESTARGIWSMLEKSRIPAAFAFLDPARSELAQEVQGSVLKHEVAIQADPRWTVSAPDRTRFAQELSKRLESSRALGFSISTLVLRHGEIRSHLDLLVKHRISVIRGIPSQTLTPRLHFVPHCSRYGVWQTPDPLIFPGTGRWWLGGDTIQVQRLMQAAVWHGGTLHLVFDAKADQQAAQSFKRIARLLERCEANLKRGDWAAATAGRLAPQAVRTSGVARPAA